MQCKNIPFSCSMMIKENWKKKKKVLYRILDFTSEPVKTSQEIRLVREPLEEKDQEISRANKKGQMRTTVHMNILVLLTKTEAALKECEQRRSRLEEELHIKLTDQKQRYLDEFSVKGKHFN